MKLHYTDSKGNNRIAAQEKIANIGLQNNLHNVALVWLHALGTVTRSFYSTLDCLINSLGISSSLKWHGNKSSKELNLKPNSAELDLLIEVEGFCL